MLYKMIEESEVYEPYECFKIKDLFLPGVLSFV